VRKLNAKLLLGLLLGSLLGTGAVFAIHHFQYGRIAESLLWQARHAEEQGKVRQQARYLQHYLEFNRHDLDAKARLAVLWAGDEFADSPRERVKAVRLLDDVLSQGDEKPVLRRLLVKVALEVRQFKMARNHLEKLLTRDFLKKPPDVDAAPPKKEGDAERGEAMGYAGQLLEAENQPAQALRCYYLAKHYAPQTQANYIRLALLLRKRDRLDPTQSKAREEADKVIDELVANNTESSEAYLSRWRYRRDFGLINVNPKEVKDRQVKLEEAAEDVKQALRRDGEKVEVLLAAIDLERMQAQAAPLQAETAEQGEKEREVHRDKALAYLKQGLEKVGQARPSAMRDATRFRLLWHKANLRLDDIEWIDGHEGGDKKAEQRKAWAEEVEQLLAEIRKTRGSEAGADFLKARLRLQEHRWAEAVTLLEQVRLTLGAQPGMAAQINRSLGQCYEQLSEPGQMYQAYERLRASEPNSVPALLGMAQAEWKLNHLDKAAALYRQLRASRRMPPRVFIDHARLEIQLQFQQDQPNWPAIEHLLKDAESVNPEAIEVPLMRAQLAMIRGDVQQARKILQETQSEKVWKDNDELWAARVLLELQDRHKDDKHRSVAQARRVLDEAKKKLGERVVLLRLAEARLLAAENAAAAEAAIERLADDADRFPKEDDRARLFDGLADVQISLEKIDAARRLLQRMAQLPSRRTDLQLQLRLFDLASKAKDEAGVRQTLNAIRDLEGRQGPFHRYGEAVRLLARAGTETGEQRRATLKEAREHLDRVESLRPNWPQLFLARAQLERLADRKDKAIANLKLARENGDNSPAVIRQLVELLAEAQRFKEADAELRNLRGAVLVHSDLGRMAAILALLRKDTDRARKLFTDNRAAEAGDNYRELLFQGRMFAEFDQPKEAEERLRSALKLAPREPEPYVALVQFFVRQKREKEADALLEQARKNLSGEQIELTLGLCYEILGRKKSAQARYEEALSEHRRDVAVVRRVAAFYWSADKLVEAEPLLRDIIEGRVRNASDDDVAWARRHLALVLAKGNDYGRFREALDLVGLKLDNKGQIVRQTERERTDSSDVRRYQARVLASQSVHRPFRKRACELLEELERHKALPPDDRFVLGMLYESDNAWAKAKPILRDLAEQRDPAPRHLAFYVQMLLEHKELEEAAKQVQRLEALEDERAAEPNAFAAIELRARLLEEENKGDKAVALLERHVQRKGASGDEVLLVLNSLQRQKRFAEALERCLQAWKNKKASPEVIGGASVAVLRGMQLEGTPATAEQAQAIEQQLSNALEAKPQSAMLMLHLAELYDQCGRWEQAETMYRRVLEPDHEPHNIVALNNLAWLLVQRSGDRRKHEEALTRIESAVSGFGRRADLIDTRGMVYLKLGQESAALVDFRDAVADMPTPARLFHLARAHYQGRDKTNAVKILKRAKEQGLQANLLHPGEQSAYQKMLMELKVR
jgi:tetratricopeptide (TPR) repeat protein